MYSRDFLDLLQSGPAGRFFVSTHKFCDGDGLGAGLALCRGLKKSGQNAVFLTLEKPHPKYRFLDPKKDIRIFDKNKTQIPEKSVFIFIDVNDTQLVEPLYSFAKQKKAMFYFIDHHPLIDERHANTDDRFFIDSKSSSTAELVSHLLKELNIPIDRQMAVCLFASIVFDTNSFRDIKNSPRPFALAADLVPKIPDVNLIYESLFKHLTADKLRFMSQLEKAEYHFDNRLAILHLKEKDFKKYNTDFTQACDLMEIIRNVDTVESTALIIENESGSFKLSMRSGRKDLLPLAKSFGGGGHSHSAGAFVKNLSLKEIKDKLAGFFAP